MKTTKRLIVLLCTLGLLDVATAADSGFLTDYSKLGPAPERVGAERFFMVEDMFERLPGYSGIFIDQPEIFIAEDSKYKGVKPDELKVVADTFREAVAREVYQELNVVAAPAKDSLVIRLALSNVHVEKEKRGLLGYTPIGAVVYAVKGSLEDLTHKVRLKDAVFEVELDDAESGEMLAAGVHVRAPESSAKELTWDAAVNGFVFVGRRTACRLHNAKLPKDQWLDCLVIQEEGPKH